MTRYLTAAIALVLALAPSFGSSPVFAAAETNVSSGLTLQGSGLAVHGYDVVAYFTAGAPTRGSAEYSTEFENATYRFASKANRKAFEKDPQRYMPRYGGYCAFGVSVGAKFDGDPTQWKIVGDRLYVLLNQEIFDTWSKDIPGNIAKAERNWREISGKRPEELK